MQDDREEMIDEIHFAEKSIIQMEHRARMAKMASALGIMMILIILMNM
ncbi:MAG: hypothetical protein JRJ79_07710 [Deltaproteobacteria bacterium]|nr:hypothetical protein [Deltaproteobacteria bacterium]